MRETLTPPDVLNAVTAIAVADLRRNDNQPVRDAVFEACEALISAGLVPIDTAPDVWRCCEQNQQNTVDALRSYLERQ